MSNPRRVSTRRTESHLVQVRTLWPEIDAHALAPLGDGWTCDTYDVDGRWIVQFPRTAYAEEALRKQRAILPRLAAKLPVPIPVPVPASDPDAPAMLYPRIEGKPFTERPGGDWPEQLGIMLSEMQTIPSASIGVRYRTVDDLRDKRREQLDEMSEKVLPLLKSGHRTRLQRIFYDYLRDDKAWSFLPVLVHDDLGPAHILVNESGDLAGVIDWEGLSVGDPAADFAWMMETIPAIGRRMLEAFGGPSDGSFSMRCRFLYLLMPFHEVIYGLESGQQSFVDSGLEGIVSRIRGVSD